MTQSTETKDMPEWQKDYVQNTIFPLAQNIANSSFTPYTGERVAGLSGMEQYALNSLQGMKPADFSGVGAAYGQMGGVVDRANQGIGAAGDIYGNVAQGAAFDPTTFQGNVAKNLAGFQTNVIDPTMAAMDRRFAQERVGEAGTITGANAFGNTRRDVFQGEREAARDVNMAQTIANLQQQGYNQATATAMAQAQAQQQGAIAGAGGMQSGAQIAANLGLSALGQQAQGALSQGQAQQAANLGLASAQLQAGQLPRSISQLGLDAAYQQYGLEQQYPFQQLGALTGVAPAYGAGSYGTTTKTGGIGDIFSGLGSLGQGLGAMGFGPSDIRLKKNIKHIATENGIKYYRWEWNDVAKDLGLDDTPPMGVIAQELGEIHPDLVVRGDDGYLRVNYGGLAAKQGSAA